MHALDIGLAFLEGLALIASPCILPVLPLVLSASAAGGRQRPFGIIVGFVVAFSAFVLAARQIVAALHIDLDIIKYVSLGLLFLLGLVMLSEKLSQKFATLTQGLANTGANLSGGGEGFIGGIAIGALIGLVWTPCAGPILAAVLVQVIRQQTSLQGIAVTLSFALGAGVPMLLIALMGRTIVARAGFLSKHAEAARKIFGILIMVSVLWLAFAPDLSAAPGDPAPSSGGSLTLEDGLAKPYPAPEFTGIATWLNSPPLTMAGLKGKVVLIDFWTYSCINCVRTLPYITSWDHKYRDKGLVIIGVHAPEFEFEKKIDNIKTAITKYGIAYPVAVDNDLATWVAFDNHYWPAHYLIDKNGQVVSTHFGEGHYDITENNIRYLLGLTERAAPESLSVGAPYLPGQTPETYLGYDRADRFAGGAVQKEVPADYQPTASLPEHEWDLAGRWQVEGQRITAQAPGAALRLAFKARKVFLVMGTADNAPHKITLLLNGAPPGAQSGKDVQGGAVTITGHALYELIDQKDFQTGTLTITADAPGVELYAFTFGD